MTDKHMRQWAFTDYGIQRLKRSEAPIPQPGPGQILVKVDAVSLNYRDLLLASDSYPQKPTLPYVPGSDMAGVVVATGEGVRRWQGGERVISTFVTDWIDGAAPNNAAALGSPGPGVLASHVLLSEQWAVKAPTSLTPAQASTLPCAALTAWFALVEEGAIHAGQTVLVHGTGGVALFGLQLARMHGATVIVVSGGADKREKALALGASHVIARDADWVAEVLRLTDGRGAEQILETVGGTNFGKSLQALAARGRISMIGVIEGGEISGSAYQTIGTRAVIQGISVGHRNALERLVRAVDANRLQPEIAAEYAFDDAHKAFAHLERGAFGKVVIRL